MNENPKEKSRLLSKVKNMIRETLHSLKEERVIFAASLLSFICLTLHIYEADSNFKILGNTFFLELCFSFFMSCIFTIPTAYLTQSFKPLKKYLIQLILAGIGALLGFFAHRGFGNPVYEDLYYWGIVFAVILITVFIFIPKDKEKTYFAGLVKYFLFSGLMATVLLGGICLLIFAFSNLIFDFDSKSELYGTCAAFCYLVFAVNIFVYYLFYRREEEDSGKAFKVIFLYILLPVFFFLIALLYAYLFKALFMLQLPNGQINWFVSFASCFYIFFYFILTEYKELAAVKIFYRFGALAFIPLICVQIPAYFIRLTAYGFTGWRFSSLLFIIFSIIAIAFTFIKKGRLVKYSILLLAGIIIFASLSPFNIIKAAYNNQLKRMISVLEKYDMYDSQNKELTKYNAQIINQTISDDDRQKLLSSYNYLALKSHLKMPEWAIDINGHPFDFKFLFDIEADKGAEIIYRHYNCPQTKEIDISNYKKMKVFIDSRSSWGWINKEYQEYANEIPHAEIENDGIIYDITDFLLSDPGNDRDTNWEQNEYLFYSLDENVILCIISYSYSWNEERKLFKDYSVNGYIFWK